MRKDRKVSLEQSVRKVHRAYRSRVRRDHKGYLDHRALPESVDRKGYKGHKDRPVSAPRVHKGIQERSGHRGHKATPVESDLKDSRDHQEHRVPLAQESKDHKASLALLDHRVHSEDLRDLKG